MYFQVFVPTGLKYISTESYSGMSNEAFNSDPKDPFREGGVGLGRPLQPRVTMGPAEV